MHRLWSRCQLAPLPGAKARACVQHANICCRASMHACELRSCSRLWCCCCCCCCVSYLGMHSTLLAGRCVPPARSLSACWQGAGHQGVRGLQERQQQQPACSATEEEEEQSSTAAQTEAPGVLLLRLLLHWMRAVALLLVWCLSHKKVSQPMPLCCPGSPHPKHWLLGVYADCTDSSSAPSGWMPACTAGCSSELHGLICAGTTTDNNREHGQPTGRVRVRMHAGVCL